MGRVLVELAWEFAKACIVVLIVAGFAAWLARVW